MSRQRSHLIKTLGLMALALFLTMLLAGGAMAADAGDVIINEIMQNPFAVGDSAGEWFELYNPTGGDIDIEGWTIADAGVDSHVINNGGPLVIPAGGYLVLGNNADSGTNGGVTVGYSYGSSWFLSNSDDEVILSDGSLTEIDRVEYDGGPNFPDPNGASMALIDPALDNNVGANWCEATSSYGAGDMGTPGQANDCPVDTVEVVINEIMQNPDAVFDSAGEWFELYNPTGGDIDIEGWTIADNDSDSHVINNGGPLLIPAGGYLVLGNNTDMSSNGGAAVDYSYGSNWFLSNGADEVVLFDGSLTEIDRVNYDGGPNFPDPTGASMSLSDPTLDNNVGANWCQSVSDFGDGDLGTPGQENVCELPPVPLACDDDSVITLIHDVQGAGATSPLVGQEVVIDGVVVGDFQNNAEADSGDLNGFYVQEEEADADADVMTSEGILVYAPGAADVMSGDHVRVRGTVSEFATTSGGITSEMTEISLSALAICETTAVAPAATPVTLPVANPVDVEWYEGMLVTFPQSLSISEYFNFDRFNEVVLTPERLYQPTAIFDPGSPEAAGLADLNARSKITLDDGRTSQNSDPAIHPNGADFTLANRFRGGDTVEGVTGVIDESFALYRIQPTGIATYTLVNDRPAAPDPVGGRLQVASLNVLNYFTTLDDGKNDICGPEENLECRGADNQDELDRQRAKIVAALYDLDADIFGLMEIQNSGNDEAVADLVAGLNDMAGAGTYDYIPTGFMGTDAIAQAFIYKVDTVSPLGAFALLDDPSFLDPMASGQDKNRPALAQTFVEDANGAVVTVVVNHLKSKGSGCGGGDDDLEQGNCNGTRTAAAGVLASWLATDPTGSGDADVLIIGDLNSYDKEDPIGVLTSAGFTDLVYDFGDEYAYSYLFSAQLGYLDYGMANSSLSPQVTGTTIWHINADEPDILDYDTSFKQPAQEALYEPNAYRASDHDPVIIGLDLNRPPVCTWAYPSIPSLWSPNHRMFPVSVMGVYDPDGDPFTINIDSVFQDEPVNGIGDGHTSPDAEGIGTDTAQVRAERSGKGNGRFYHINFTATDDHGNSCSGTVKLSVGKSEGRRLPVDEGPLYDSTIDAFLKP